MAKKTDLPWQHILGRNGEVTVLAYLRKKGWRVCAQNWRAQGTNNRYELDIVAWEGDTLVFVEVKTRSAGQNVPAYTAFHCSKARAVREAARLYLTEHNAWDVPCRFDLVCVVCETDGTFNLQQYSHVIENGQTLDRGNASWQPW